MAAREFTSPKDEIKATIYDPIIENISGELSERFCTQNHVVLGKLYELLMSFQNKKNFQPDSISSVAAFYNLSEEALKAEIHVLHNCSDLTSLTSIQQLGHYFIGQKLTAWFPLLCYLMRVYLTLPVTSASSERSFSQLKLLKDDKRSTMLESRLRGLALMKIEKQYLKGLKVPDILKIFVDKKERRQKFS